MPSHIEQSLHEIQLSRSDISSLSQVSHAYRALCEPIIFNITLSNDKKRALRIPNNMLNRLGDPEGGLNYSVKNITVGYASTTTQLPESLLILAFRNIRALETLTWSTWLPITSPILNCLHEAHPSARLVAITLERNDLPLDELLLSSPQLHTLDVKLSALYDKNFRKQMVKSEAQRLKSLLIQGSSLKISQTAI